MSIVRESEYDGLTQFPDVVERVDRNDFDTARNLIHQAVDEACDQWIPVHVVAEAVVAELMALMSDHASAEQAASLLRAFAKAIVSERDAVEYN